MRRINIVKNGVVTNSAREDMDPNIDAWLEMCVAKEKFGKPGTYEVVVEDMTAEIEAKAKIDNDKEEICIIMKKYSDYQGVLSLSDCSALLIKICKYFGME